MSSTQFVEMYHPLIVSTITTPARVSLRSVDEWAAKGWLLVDPDGVLPSPSTPYYTTAAADSRFAKVADLGTPGTLTGDTLRAAYGSLADMLALGGLDRSGAATAARYAGQSVVEYQDGTITTVDWTTLPSASAGVQVSGNRLYGTTNVNPSTAIIPFSVPSGAKARVTGLIQFKAGAAGTANVGIGFDCSASGAAPVANTPNGVGVIVQASGALLGFAGASMTGLGTPPAGSFTAQDGLSYEVTLSADENAVSIAIRPVGGAGTSSWVWAIPRSALAAIGKTINNIFVFDQDQRGLSGHSVSPIVAVASQQPSRTKTVAGITVTGATHKDVGTVSVGTTPGDKWRIGVPASYDPRRRAPVVLYCHQAAIGTQTPDRPWANAKDDPVTEALMAAGFIVAAANDGSPSGSVDRWGNQASLDNYLDLYNYLRSHYATGPVCLWALSMGGVPSLNMLARRRLPQVAAWAGISSVADLDAMHADAAFTASIDTAYAVDGTHPYASQTAGFNPMTRSGWEFRGVPMRFYVASDDTVVPPSAHATPFAAKVTPYAPEAAIVTVTGGHLPSTAYQPSDLVGFFSKYV